MNNLYKTLYTKEHGKIDLTLEEYRNFDFNIITCHRTDGPAAIRYRKDGSIERERYYINNKFHRLDGPATIYYNKNGSVGCEYYYINGKRHRIYGPAVIWYYKYGSVSRESYFINDKYYDTKEDYYNLINEMKSLPKSLRLTHEEQWVRELLD